MSFIVKDLLENCGIVIPEALQNMKVTGITSDSRKVSSGFLFVAIKGFKTDGHRYINNALASGATAVLAESIDPAMQSQLVLVNPTGNNRHLLAVISARYFGNPWEELKTIGITGTNGKTSTAHTLRWILEKTGTQTGIMGTVGHIVGGRVLPASVTTPDSVDVAMHMRNMVESGDSACVMEVSSHALALDRVSSVKFDISLFTNISQDHLDFHSSMEEYLKTKQKLFSLTKPNGINIVGTYAPDWPNVPGSVTFGETAEDAYRITDIEVQLTGSSFVFNTPDGAFPVSIKAPGRFNVYNVAGALASAILLGVSPCDAVEAVSSFPGVPGRMESVNCGQDFLIAVDYAHTPDALERVLKQGSLLAENRLIAVFGCGGDRDNTKRPLMGRIAAEIADIAFVTSDNPRTEDPYSIINEILSGIPSGFNPVVEQDRSQAIKQAIDIAREGDVLIIAGKGHEDYQIIGTEKIHFDDREQARNVLIARGYKCTR